MRLTINLDDDLYAMARSHAIATKTSISKAVGDLLRRKTAAVQAPQTSSSYFDPVLGIQVSRSEHRLTEEEIQRAMDDEDVRAMEIMGLSPEEIDAALKR